MNFRITYDGAPAFCAQCDRAYTRYSPRGKYCSTACKQAAYRARKAGDVTPKTKKSKVAPYEKYKARPCPRCGKYFTAKSAKKTFCSDSCKVMSNRKKQERTIASMGLLKNIEYGQAYVYVDEIGWKAAYAELEQNGLIWVVAHELWLPANQRDLWGDTPQGRRKIA